MKYIVCLHQRVGSFAAAQRTRPDSDLVRWGLIVPEFNLANMSTPNLPMENPVGSNEIASWFIQEKHWGLLLCEARAMYVSWVKLTVRRSGR